LRRQCLLKKTLSLEGDRGQDRSDDEEEDVSSYWVALRKKRRYCKLKEEALDPSLWRTSCGREYGLVRETT